MQYCDHLFPLNSDKETIHIIITMQGSYIKNNLTDRRTIQFHPESRFHITIMEHFYTGNYEKKPI